MTANSTASPSADNLTTRELVAAIRRELKALGDGTRWVDRAVGLGRMFIEMKARVKREGDDWIPWVRATFGISEDTAENYMNIARNSEHSERVRNAKSIN